MKFDQSLTVIVTAFNEEENILSCLTLLENFLETHLRSYQIILVDDGSLDRTVEIVHSKESIKNFSFLKMETNQGVGACIKKALPYVNSEWFCWFPSDLEFLPIELLKPISQCSHNDIVITHAFNSKVIRSPLRYHLSKVFNGVLNLSFALNLKYYNGITFYRKSVVLDFNVHSNRFFFHAELLLKSLRRTKKYQEVPIFITTRKNGQSSALKWKVLKDIACCYFINVWELRIKADECINH